MIHLLAVLPTIKLIVLVGKHLLPELAIRELVKKLQVKDLSRLKGMPSVLRKAHCLLETQMAAFDEEDGTSMTSNNSRPQQPPQQQHGGLLHEDSAILLLPENADFHLMTSFAMKTLGFSPESLIILRRALVVDNKLNSNQPDTATTQQRIRDYLKTTRQELLDFLLGDDNGRKGPFSIDPFFVVLGLLYLVIVLEAQGTPFPDACLEIISILCSSYKIRGIIDNLIHRADHGLSKTEAALETLLHVSAFLRCLFLDVKKCCAEGHPVVGKNFERISFLEFERDLDSFRHWFSRISLTSKKPEADDIFNLYISVEKDYGLIGSISKILLDSSILEPAFAIAFCYQLLLGLPFQVVQKLRGKDSASWFRILSSPLTVAVGWYRELNVRMHSSKRSLNELTKDHFVEHCEDLQDIPPPEEAEGTAVKIQKKNAQSRKCAHGQCSSLAQKSFLTKILKKIPGFMRKANKVCVCHSCKLSFCGAHIRFRPKIAQLVCEDCFLIIFQTLPESFFIRRILDSSEFQNLEEIVFDGSSQRSRNQRMPDFEEPDDDHLEHIYDTAENN